MSRHVVPRRATEIAGAAVVLALLLAGPVACADPPPGVIATSPSPSSSRPVTAASSGRPRPTPSPPRTTPRAAPTPVPTTPAPHPAVAPGWLGPIYAPRLHGYDMSYPQCPGMAPPPGAGFSIIGVNAGRAFSANPCLRAEWLRARGIRAVYFNSGYDPDNAILATPDCVSRSQYQAGGAERQTAYAIGCSEAVFAVNAMNAAGAGRAVMVWLDVERSNSWDPSNLDLNRTALQAEIDQLAAFGRIVGLYATFLQWHEILGDWSPAGVVADWLAGQEPQDVCGTGGFSGHPVWMAQELGTWPGPGVDSDWTC